MGKTERRYCVGRQCMYPAINLPSSLGLRFGKLASTVDRMRRQASLLAKYDNTFQEQLRSGITERVKD